MVFETVLKVLGQGGLCLSLIPNLDRSVKIQILKNEKIVFSETCPENEVFKVLGMLLKMSQEITEEESIGVY